MLALHPVSDDDVDVDVGRCSGEDDIDVGGARVVPKRKAGPTGRPRRMMGSLCQHGKPFAAWLVLDKCLKPPDVYSSMMAASGLDFLT